MCNQINKCVLARRAQIGDFLSRSLVDAAPQLEPQTETVNQFVAGYFYNSNQDVYKGLGKTIPNG